MFRLVSYVFELIILILIGRMVSRAMQSLFKPPPPQRGAGRNAPQAHREAIRGGETVRDPVCGMFVSTELSHRLKRGTETLHFCSEECLKSYQQNTAKA